MAYWTFVAVLVVFGVLSGFSIGIPFLLLGMTLICVSPFRGRRVVFWPPIAAVLGLIAGFIVVAPFACVAETSGTSQGIVEEHAECKSAVGITYPLSDDLDGPSFLPAWIAGGATAAAAALLTWLIVSRREPDRR